MFNHDLNEHKFINYALVCVVYGVCTSLWIYTEAIWYPAWSLSTLFHQDHISHWTQDKAGDQQAPAVLLSLPSPSCGGDTCVWDHDLTFYMDAGDSNSGHHACTASILTQWTISPAQNYTLDSRCLKKDWKILREAYITSWKPASLAINEKPWSRKVRLKHNTLSTIWIVPDWQTLGLLSLPQKVEMSWHFDAKVRGIPLWGT